MCHGWWLRGQRASGLHDRRFDETQNVGAVEPGSRGSSNRQPPDGHTVLEVDGPPGTPTIALQDQRTSP